MRINVANMQVSMFHFAMAIPLEALNRRDTVAMVLDRHRKTRIGVSFEASQRYVAMVDLVIQHPHFA